MTLKQDAGPKEFVFSNSRTGVNIDSIKTGWRNACEDAGLVNLRLHDTRHHADCPIMPTPHLELAVGGALVAL